MLKVPETEKMREKAVDRGYPIFEKYAVFIQFQK